MRGRRWRFALVGTAVGYMLGLVVAFPAVTIVYGEATTRIAHRPELYRWGYLGGLFGLLVGFCAGWLLAGRSGGPDDGTSA